MKRLTKAKRARIQALLTTAQETQTEFWDALRALEHEVGDLDDIGTTDLEMHTVDSIVGFAEDSVA
jgi:hypothetical protein